MKPETVSLLCRPGTHEPLCLTSAFNQRYQRFYNRIAVLYDVSIKLFASLVGGGEAHFRGEYLRELEIQDDSRVVEVSIGTGANLLYLPAKATYFGVDLSWGMPKKCQRNLKQWQLEAELILGNAEELPLCDETFDMEAFAWVPGTRKWLQEHGERFSAPVGLVPEGMRDVQVKEIAKGNMYCLIFKKLRGTV